MEIQNALFVVDCAEQKLRGQNLLLKTAQIDGDNPFKELNQELSREINPTEYEMTSHEFLRLDDNVCTTEKHLITDE